MNAQSEPRSLFAAARACLDASSPGKKVALSGAAAQAWRRGQLGLGDAPGPEPIPAPGRPDRPRLVPPGRVAQRGIHTAAGRIALVHALAHIELNAIDLAWDAVYRFRGLPRAFYDDWVRVAEEEAGHFDLLAGRLKELGRAYGDLDAHNGLWEMALKTDHDPLVRMALVPRVLEARGLDVSPGMMQRLREAGDHRTVAILEVILRDEIGHVAIGSRWFRYLCEQRGQDPARTFRELVSQYMKGRIKGPFHEQARVQAGFTQDELDELKRQAGASR